MDNKAIEAAARAIAELWWNTFPINEPGRKQWWLDENWKNYTDQAQAAIDAYLAASGIAEDAARYRWLRMADDVPLLRGESDLLMGDALDAAIDAARG